mgnify:FL=1
MLLKEYPNLLADMICPSDNCLIMRAWHKEFADCDDDPHALGFVFDYSRRWLFAPLVTDLLQRTSEQPSLGHSEAS